MNLFHQRFANESRADDVIARAMAKPGIVVKTPRRLEQTFRRATRSAHRHLSGRLSVETDYASKKKDFRPQKKDELAERRAYEKERAKRERQREMEKAAAQRAREKRDAAIEKAQAALGEARREHEEIAAEIEKDLAAVQRRADKEEARWHELGERLEEDLRKARR